jgi:hypothetical protein
VGGVYGGADVSEAVVHVILDHSLSEGPVVFASLDELTTQRVLDHLTAALGDRGADLELDVITLDDDSVVRELLDGRAEGS